MPLELRVQKTYLCLDLLDKALPQKQRLNCTHGTADVLSTLTPESAPALTQYHCWNARKRLQVCGWDK